MTHTLKIHPEFFLAIWDGSKTYELRGEEDRSFAVGDRIILREWDPARITQADAYDQMRADPDARDTPAFAALEAQGYTGRSVPVDITHILRDARWLQPHVAALSIRRVSI